MRIVQTLPTPTIASTAITMWAGTISAAALPTKQANAQVGVRMPSTARLYIASRTATAASPYRVIPKINPTAHALKSAPGMNGTGARKRHARNPKRKAPRDAVPVIRLTTVPVSAAAASNRIGSTIRWRASQWRRAEERDRDGSEPCLAPVVPGLDRQALDVREAGRRVDRLGPGLRQIRAEDRVVRLVVELEGLDAIARAQRQC